MDQINWLNFVSELTKHQFYQKIYSLTFFTLEAYTKLGWDVKIKSMQGAELLKICVGSFFMWLKLNWKVIISSCYIVQLCILTFKPPDS